MAAMMCSVQSSGLAGLQSCCLRQRPALAVTACRRRPRMHIACSAAASSPATSTSYNGNGTHAQHATPTPTLSPVPQVAAAQATAPVPGVLPPPAAYAAVVNLGKAKAELPAWKSLAMGVLAGCYISFGGFMAVTLATATVGYGNPILTRLAMGALFPFGLLITLVVGAELYTGNTALVTAAVLEKKANANGLIKNWIMSYLGNLIGSLLLVAMVAGTGLVSSAVPSAMAVAKTSIPFGQAFLRGVLCNWLVVAAVWMASAASTLPGKAVAAYMPVMAFITMGLEHSVANMFFIALGIVLGAPVTWADMFVKNLLPVTLGNTAAGVVMMAAAYAFVYGSLGKPAPVPKPAAA